jgi:transcriptional regulator with XRE-family HTH domain
MLKKVGISEMDKIIAKRIKLRRLMLGMSQSDLAKLCGVSFQQIQKYEAALNRTYCAQLFRISQALKVPIEFFFDTENKMYKIETLELLVLYLKLHTKSQKNMVLNLLKCLVSS